MTLSGNYYLNIGSIQKMLWFIWNWPSNHWPLRTVFSRMCKVLRSRSARSSNSASSWKICLVATRIWRTPPTLSSTKTGAISTRFYVPPWSKLLAECFWIDSRRRSSMCQPPTWSKTSIKTYTEGTLTVLKMIFKICSCDLYSY